MKTKLIYALIIIIALLVAPLWAKGPNGPSTSSGLTDTEKSNILYIFEVGVDIEEMDIDDIERMQEDTDNADIQRVLSNLLDGS